MDSGFESLGWKWLGTGGTNKSTTSGHAALQIILETIWAVELSGGDIGSRTDVLLSRLVASADRLRCSPKSRWAFAELRPGDDLQSPAHTSWDRETNQHPMRRSHSVFVAPEESTTGSRLRDSAALSHVQQHAPDGLSCECAVEPSALASPAHRAPTEKPAHTRLVLR